MTPLPHPGAMRSLAALVVAAALAHPAPDEPLPADLAAAHPEGTWTVRKADLYRYLVRTRGGGVAGKDVLAGYLMKRFVEGEARKRNLLVTDDEVDTYIAGVEKQVLQQTGGATTLDEALREKSTTRQEFVRITREFLQREHVARDEYRKKDPTRDPNRELEERDVGNCLDLLYQATPKELDRARLPEGVVAQIGDQTVTEYDYGRVLATSLSRTEVANAVGDLALAEESKLLPGGDKPPSPAAIEAHKAWFLESERARLRERVGDPALVTDDLLKQVLAQRGLTLEQIFAEPAFLADARSVDHFIHSRSEEEVRKYHEANRHRYGDRVRVARILVQARAQREVRQAGKQIRTLEQGKAAAEALFLRAGAGEDFAALARQSSEDADGVKRNGGEIPGWLTEGRPGYETTFEAAKSLGVGQVSRPTFEKSQGFVIVKLLQREPAPPYETVAVKVRRDAGLDAYRTWRKQRMQVVRVSETLVEER